MTLTEGAVTWLSTGVFQRTLAGELTLENEPDVPNSNGADAGGVGRAVEAGKVADSAVDPPEKLDNVIPCHRIASIQLKSVPEIRSVPEDRYFLSFPVLLEPYVVMDAAIPETASE